MAIVIPTLFSQMSGAVGDIVLTRNRYASTVIRARTIPTDPETSSQLANREIFRQAVSEWHDRTEIDRESWAQYALSTPWFNALGQSCRLTAFNMYISVYVHNFNDLGSANPANFDIAPTTPGMFPLPVITFSAPAPTPPNTHGVRIFITNQDSINITICNLWASYGHKTSENFYRGPYEAGRVLRVANINPLATVNRNIRDLDAGTRAFFRFRLIDSDNRNRISRYHYGFANVLPNF